MKIRHLAFVVAISTLASGTSMAQTSFFNTNTNTNNTNNQTFISGTTFSLSNNNMTISQNNPGDANSFCQFFTFTFGLTRIIQIIQGNSFSQSFGSASDPVTDPCL